MPLPKHPLDLPELLNVADIAAWLKKSCRAVYHMRERGQLPPPIRVGRSLLWDRGVLCDWLAQKQRAVSSRSER